MWERIKCSCGHTMNVQLLGKTAERDRKREWMQRAGLCKDCYREYTEQCKAANCQVIESSYSLYKKYFNWCDTVKDSYNKDTKSIKFYVPNEAVSYCTAVIDGDDAAMYEAVYQLNVQDSPYRDKVTENLQKIWDKEEHEKEKFMTGWLLFMKEIHPKEFREWGLGE